MQFVGMNQRAGPRRQGVIADNDSDTRELVLALSIEQVRRQINIHRSEHPAVLH